MALRSTFVFILLAGLALPIFADDYGGPSGAPPKAPSANKSRSSRRGPCAEDYQKFCKDVRPGEGRAAKCMNEHKDELSDACKQAAEKAKEKLKGISEACKEDAQQFCKDIKPGSGNILRCLRDHKEEVSAGCKQAFSQGRPRRKRGADSEGKDG